MGGGYGIWGAEEDFAAAEGTKVIGGDRRRNEGEEGGIRPAKLSRFPDFYERKEKKLFWGWKGQGGGEVGKKRQQQQQQQRAASETAAAAASERGTIIACLHRGREREKSASDGDGRPKAKTVVQQWTSVDDRHGATEKLPPNCTTGFMQRRLHCMGGCACTLFSLTTLRYLQLVRVDLPQNCKWEISSE